MGSHRRTIWQRSLPYCYPNKPNPNKFHQANWEKYREHVLQNLPELQDTIKQKVEKRTNHINTILSKLNEVIVKVANDSIPKTTNSTKPKTTPWWNEECEIAIKESKKALNKFKKDHSLKNKIDHSKLKAIAKRTIKKSKQNSWLTYLQSICYKTTSKEMWEKIKAIEGRKEVHDIILKDENQIISNPTEIANIFAKQFAENSSDKHYDRKFLKHKKKSDKQLDAYLESIEHNNEAPLNSPTSMKELSEVIEISKNSSPGPDEIPNILIKNLPKEAHESILEIFNIIWTEQIFSDLWRKAIVVPIPKPKKSRFEKESYRPISLTCCLCKTLEKIINKRLRWYLEINNIISKFQSGFRENCSTNDCLLSLETNIRRAFENNETLLAVCLDVEKAYDLV